MGGEGRRDKEIEKEKEDCKRLHEEKMYYKLTSVDKPMS